MSFTTVCLAAIVLIAELSLFAIIGGGGGILLHGYVLDTQLYGILHESTYSTLWYVFPVVFY